MRFILGNREHGGPPRIWFWFLDVSGTFESESSIWRMETFPFEEFSLLKDSRVNHLFEIIVERYLKFKNYHIFTIFVGKWLKKKFNSVQSTSTSINKNSFSLINIYIRSILSVIRKTNSTNYLFDRRKVDFARNGYTTECINFHEKQRAGELSAGLDPPRGFYKRMLPAVAQNLSLSLSLLPSSFCWKVTKVPIYQVQSFVPSRRDEEEMIQEA